MTPSSDPRLETYKQKIGWEQLKEPGSPLGGVAVEWPDISKAPTFQGAAWKLIADDIHFTEALTERQWVMRQQRQNVSVKIAVSSSGWPPARDHFLRTISSTTMLDIPYQRSPKLVGSLSVETIGDHTGIVIWLFRNVCFQIRADETDLDPRLLAAWLQGHASAAVVDDLAPRLPQIEQVELSDSKLRVGATLTAKVWLSPNSPAVEKHYFAFNHDRSKLDLLEEHDDNVRYRALAAGPTRITARVADRRTLLAKEMGADITVQ